MPFKNKINLNQLTLNFSVKRINELISNISTLFAENKLDAYVIKKHKKIIVGAPSELKTDDGRLFDYCLKFSPKSIRHIEGGLIIDDKTYTSAIRHTCRTGLSTNWRYIPITALNFAVSINYLNKDNVSSYPFQIIPHFLDAFAKAEAQAKVKVPKINEYFSSRLLNELDMVLNNMEKDKMLDKYHLIIPGILVNLANITGADDNLVKRISKKSLVPFLITASMKQYTENGYGHLEDLLFKTFSYLVEKGEINRKELESYLDKVVKYNTSLCLKLAEKYNLNTLRLYDLAPPVYRFGTLFDL